MSLHRLFRLNRLVLAAVLVACLASLPLQASPAHFAIAQGHFLLDGKPYLIRAGEMHYVRIPRADWHDRLRKARALGLNTITTYAFWNANEPAPGRFDFSGDKDIAAFIRAAQEEGLNVIVRPGPYICTEWDFGGLPAWLLRTPGLRVRSYDPRFLKASAAWFQRLHQELAPLLSSRGGPVLMMQVENEYGSYGEDKDYLDAIRKQMVDAGFDVPLFTSNGPGPQLLERGTLPGMQSVINFDGDVADAKEAFASSATNLKGMPKMTGEYWDGWFDYWGGKHNTRSPEVNARTVDWFLANDISFNLYMVDGGTSFGWMAGANGDGKSRYTPDTTSYDYDSPIDEAGRLTPKYFALRKVIAAHLPKGETLPSPPPSSPTMAIPRFTLDASVGLLDALPTLSTPHASTIPRSMEAFGQDYGLILYRKKLDQAGKGKLDVQDVRDYATVLDDGAPVGTLDRRLNQHDLPVDLQAGSTLDLLVENMGRINFAAAMPEETKGITWSVSLDRKDLTGWTIYPLPLDDLSTLRFRSGATPKGPAFWRGHFDLATLRGGTFLDMRGWGKGNVWVNGHHLGRYWKIGPQQSLYLPAAWLRTGSNEVVVLEMEHAGSHSLQGIKDPVFEAAAKTGH